MKELKELKVSCHEELPGLPVAEVPPPMTEAGRPEFSEDLHVELERKRQQQHASLSADDVDTKSEQSSGTPRHKTRKKLVKDYELVIARATHELQADPHNVKALLHRGQAFAKKGA